MARRYTDNELLALTRNRREAKALRIRIGKLDDEKALFHDVCGKEKKKMVDIRKGNQRSSGHSPFPDDDIDIRNATVDQSLMRKFSKPWAVCPAETTHNVVYKEIASIRSSTSGLRPKSESNRWTRRQTVTVRNPTNLTADKRHSSLSTSAKERRTSPTTQNCNNEKNEDIVSKADRNGNFTAKSERNAIGEDIQINNNEKPNEHNSFSSGEHTSDVTDDVKPENSSRSKSNSTEGEIIVNDTGKEIEIQSQDEPLLNTNLVKGHKKKRKSFQKRPSTAFTTPLPSVSEGQHPVETSLQNVHEQKSGDGLDNDVFGKEQSAEGIHESGREMVQDAKAEEGKIKSEITKSDIHGSMQAEGTQTADRPTTCVGIERQTSRTVENNGEQRPFTVAGGEVLEFENYSDIDNRNNNVIYYKGQKIRNYVSPQERYKNDPFRFKRQEKLFTKLAKDNPDIVEDVRKNSVKVQLRLSKSARARILDQLILENSQRETSRRLGQKDKNMEGRIQEFLGSISYLCCETDERSKQMHPLLA